MKQAIIFDLDDTLLASTHNYEAAVEASGVPLAQFQIARNQVKASLPLGHTSSRHRRLYFKKYLENTNQFSAEGLETLFGKYCLELQSRLEKALYQTQVLATLDFLKKKADLFVLTNEVLEMQTAKLKVLDPRAELLSGVLVSEEVGEEKPSPRIFKVARDRFKLSSYEHIMMVGDSVEADIQPALQQGWRAVLTTEFLSSKAKHDQIAMSQSMLKTLPEELVPHFSVIASIQELTY